MKTVLIISIVVIIRIAESCNQDGKLRSVGQSCETKSDCYNGGMEDSVGCRSGKCVCNENGGYVALWQWFAPNDRRMVCQPAPYQDQPCTTVCQKPLTCASSLDDATVRTCQCQLPAITKEDGSCYLECPDGQIFEGGKCRERCTRNETKGRNGRCRKLSNLGDVCRSEDQCVTPFSQCVDGRCSCMDGFVSKGNACLSEDRSCPIGDPIRDRDTNQIVECKVTRKQNVSGLSSALTLPFPRPALLEDNCSRDQFCMLTSGDSFYAEGAIGHCCRKPKIRCPYGRPHPSATCGASIPDKSASVSTAPYCPYETHSCVRFVSGGGYEESACCPLACGTNMILIGGRCYPKRSYGDQCQHHQQCQGHVGVCTRGVCSCGRDYVLDGTVGYQYCRRVCRPNEVLLDTDRCLPRLKLGDRCDPLLSSQCPNNAQCSSEKRVCDCFCGYMRVGDACARQPTCPDSSRGPMVVSIAVERRISIKLCRVRGSNSTYAELEDRCPRGEYCAMYETDYGLCCPKPKPFCPSGTNLIGGQCNPTRVFSCGFTGACLRYMYPANDDESKEGYVCCQAPGFESLGLNLTLGTIDDDGDDGSRTTAAIHESTTEGLGTDAHKGAETTASNDLGTTTTAMLDDSDAITVTPEHPGATSTVDRTSGMTTTAAENTDE